MQVRRVEHLCENTRRTPSRPRYDQQLVSRPSETAAPYFHERHPVREYQDGLQFQGDSSVALDCGRRRNTSPYRTYEAAGEDWDSGNSSGHPRSCCLSAVGSGWHLESPTRSVSALRQEEEA